MAKYIWFENLRFVIATVFLDKRPVELPTTLLSKLMPDFEAIMRKFFYCQLIDIRYYCIIVKTTKSRCQQTQH